MVTDPDAVLALLKDPNVETQQIVTATGTPREEAGRAARLVHGIARAKAEEVATLPPVLALALLRAALAARRADMLAAATTHASKDVAKEAKRGLHVLKSRGVSVPEPARPAPVAAPAATPAEPPPPCYVSSIDSQGERAVWIARHVPGRGVEVAQVVVSDVNGLVELQIGMLGRKEYRAFAKDLSERGRNMGVLEIDRDRAKGLVAEARRRNEASGKAPPEGADAWLGRIGPAAQVEDPSARFAEMSDGEERAAVESSGGLHELPLLRGWLAEENELRALAQKLDEIAVSALYVDDRQRAEQSARVMTEAVDAAFAGERRARWASRLFAVAAHLADGGDEVHAGQAAAVTRALARGDAPSRIPFARLLVEKAFPSVASASQAAVDPAAPLIVSPR
ncbi:MAG TPA: hypothetical protein VFK85_04830 [Anaeromyxobacteraceae bacterium]|nr:hypothetical protein [Anaeromyxobacteraceae bacterium]